MTKSIVSKIEDLQANPTTQKVMEISDTISILMPIVEEEFQKVLRAKTELSNNGVKEFPKPLLDKEKEIKTELRVLKNLNKMCFLAHDLPKFLKISKIAKKSILVIDSCLVVSALFVKNHMVRESFLGAISAFSISYIFLSEKLKEKIDIIQKMIQTILYEKRKEVLNSMENKYLSKLEQ